MTEQTNTTPAAETAKAPAAPAPTKSVPKMKLLKALISGSYRTADKEIIDFDMLEVVIPKCDEDVALMHIRGRYAVMALRAAVDAEGKKVYPKRVEDIRQCFVDSLDDFEGDQLSFVGKDIKVMTYEELQDLATAKDLRRIPLPKELSGVSLREQRAIAYATYSEEVLGTAKVEDATERFMELEPLIVSGNPRRDTQIKMTNEEILEREQENQNVKGSSKDNMTMKELVALAKAKNVKYPHNATFDELYAKVYGGATNA